MGWAIMKGGMGMPHAPPGKTIMGKHGMPSTTSGPVALALTASSFVDMARLAESVVVCSESIELLRCGTGACVCCMTGGALLTGILWMEVGGEWWRDLQLPVRPEDAMRLQGCFWTGICKQVHARGQGVSGGWRGLSAGAGAALPCQAFAQRWRLLGCSRSTHNLLSAEHVESAAPLGRPSKPEEVFLGVGRHLGGCPAHTERWADLVTRDEGVACGDTYGDTRQRMYHKATHVPQTAQPLLFLYRFDLKQRYFLDDFIIGSMPVI